MYVIGVFGVTMFGNVPLNNQLDQFDLANTSPGGLRAMRQKFEINWNKFNAIRTYAAMLAFLLAIISLLKKA